MDLTSSEKNQLLDYLLAEEGIDTARPQTIARRGRADELPLSFAQERLWFLNQLEPQSACYNEPFAVHLAGALNIGALEQAISQIVRRHDVLRAVFTAVDGRPVQTIRDDAQVILPLVDLANTPRDKQREHIDKIALTEHGEPFDFTRGPLMRVKLLRLAPEEHVLLLTMHHAISDGWSVGVFFNELADLYPAFCDAKPSRLSELSIQYVDYAHWQRSWLDGETLRDALQYWKEQLGGRIPALDLPADHARPSVQTFRGRRLYFSLPGSLSAAIKGLGRQENATVFMVLLAAFQTLLYRYSGQDDVVVGSPIAGRNWPEVEGLIGCFLNTLVLRTDLAGNPSFRTLLTRVRDVATKAYSYQDVPFERLVEELHPDRDTSRNPLFQVMFVLQNSVEPRLPGLSVTPMRLDRGAVPLDLILSMEETAQGLGGWWEYNTELFDDATIARLGRHFQTLLEGVTANPDQRLSDLPLLTEDERHQLLIEWNDTRRVYPTDACLHHLFEAQVERTPDALAVVFEKQQLTYRELNRRANQLAHHLMNIGVGPDVLVGICMERSLEMVIAVLGVLKAGGAYVPVDPEYPKERLTFMLQDTGAPVLVTQERLLKELSEDRRSKPVLSPSTPLRINSAEGIDDSNPRSSILVLSEVEGRVPQMRVVCLDRGWQVVAEESDETPVTAVTPENIAYVIYTSGSTGQPKGVMISHRAICNHMFWMQDRFPLTAGDRVVQKTPFSFDASVWEFYAPLLAGVPLIMAQPGGHRDSAYLVNLIAEQKVTVLQLVPSLLQMILAEAGVDRCRSLRRVFCGGEALSLELQQSFADQLGVELHNLYGPTEASIDATFWSCLSEPNCRSVPIGRPISNTQIYLLDSNSQPVPQGVTGELYIGGNGLAHGYLNRPELTAEKFLPDPFSTMAGARLYRTGDLARFRPDGAIEFLGRIDHQVKMRGFRIELGEIEAMLSQHPAVAKSLVLIREDVPGDQRLVGYIVPNGDHADENELRAFLKKQLPDYMVPSAFVSLDALPITPNGKIDRNALPGPETNRDETEAAYVAPRDALEFQLCQIWQEILRNAHIGVKDNFFDVGGHSLLAVRLLAQVEKVCGKKLPLVTLFQGATVEELANILRQEEWKAPWSSLVAIQPRGSKPPFFCVHAAAGNVLFYSDLARNLDPDQPFYGLQAKGLDGDQDPYTRIEEMAAHYIQEIRTVQPHGPYLLGGLSFGGVLAYEMAQQLRSEGHNVGLLVLFDTYGPGYPKISPARLVRDKLKRGTRRISNNIRRLVRLDLKEQVAFALDKVEIVKKRTKIKGKKRVHRIRENILTLVCKAYVKMGLPLPASLRYLRVREADHEAHRVYTPRPYAGPVTLFRAARQPIGCDPDPKLGWGSLVNGNLEIHEIPGSHSHTLVREPQVKVVVEKLKPCLIKAQALEAVKS